MKSQTINLLKKELLLGNTLQTICWLVCCIGMFFIPNYPVYIGPFYITLSIMMTFALNQASHDILYTVLLPVRKIDTVKARFLYCGLLEIASLLCGAIAAVVRYLGHFPENSSGIGLTVAYFGLQLIIFAIFNFIFLGNVYKNPVKPGLRYLVAGIVYFITYALCELPVWIYKGVQNKITKGMDVEISGLAKVGYYFTNMEGGNLTRQLIILLGGFLIFAGSWLITFHRAAKQFEKYDI